MNCFCPVEKTLITLRNFFTPVLFFPLKTPLSKRSRLLQAVHFNAKTSAWLKKVTTFYQVSLLSSSSWRKPLTQMTMCLLFVSGGQTRYKQSTLHLWIEVSIWRVERSSVPNSLAICLMSYLSRGVLVAKAVSKRVKKKETLTPGFSLSTF